MKKIAIVIDTFLPYKGGGQFWVWENAKRLAQNSLFEVVIITRKLNLNGIKKVNSESYQNGKLNIVRLGHCATWNNFWSRLEFILLSAIYLLTNKFDLVDAQAFISAVPAKIYYFLTKKPTILTVHGTSIERKSASLLEKIILTRLKFSCQISVSSNFLKFKNTNKNIFVINPGVDLLFFNPNFPKKEKNRILFVGRLQKIKGVDVLIKCIKQTSQEKWKWIIVGDGEEMGNLQQELKHSIASHQVEIKGNMEKDQVLDEYQKASVFFLPSFSEGFPLTILEAMACGLPVVYSDVGDVSRIIENGKNGFFITSGDVEKYINAIKKILFDSNLREKMQKNNLEKAKTYSWDKTADKIIKVYQKYI